MRKINSGFGAKENDKQHRRHGTWKYIPILLSYWEFNLEKIQLGLVDKRDFVNCKIMTKYTC